VVTWSGWCRSPTRWTNQRTACALEKSGGADAASRMPMACAMAWTMSSDPTKARIGSPLGGGAERQVDKVPAGVGRVINHRLSPAGRLWRHGEWDGILPSLAARAP